MYTLLVTIHIIICIFLVCIVLLQKGKGAEIGAVFGSSEAIFGAAGPATFLNKLTTVTAVLFMLTSLSLTYMSAKMSNKSVMDSVQVQQSSLPATTSETGSMPSVDVNKPTASSQGNSMDAGKQPPPVEDPGKHLAVSIDKVEDKGSSGNATPGIDITPGATKK